MEILNSRLLKKQTAQRLSAASYPPRRLALIHTGVTMLASVVMAVVSYLLSREMAGTGGLAGMGTRAVLQSVQSILSTVLSVLMPFWEFGFVAVVLSLARKQYTDHRDLTAGFRKIGPVARLLLLQTALYMLILIGAFQVTTMAVMMLPAGEGLAELMDGLMKNSEFMRYGTIPEAMVDPLMDAMEPVIPISCVLFAGLSIPVSYRLRLARYIVMEEGKTKAFRALLQSNRTMRGKCFAYFKLDLSYWWYWLLQVLCAVLAYGDLLLPLAGVKLPLGEDVVMFAFFGLQLVSTLLIAWAWRAPVETTYAMAYHALAGEPQKEN